MEKKSTKKTTTEKVVKKANNSSKKEVEVKVTKLKKEHPIIEAIKKFDNKFFIIVVAVIVVLAFYLIIRAINYGKVPVLKDGDEVVVTLSDDKKISATDFYNQVKIRYGRDVLIDMIDTLILEDKYKVTDEETSQVASQISSIKEQVKDNFLAAIKYYYGVNTEKELEELLRLEYKRNLAINDYVEKKLTDAEINKYYKESIIGDINAKHILISFNTVDGMTEDEKTEAKEKALKEAKEVITKLNDGSKWSDLVKKYSDDTATKDKDGDLGWFNTGDMEANFETASIKLEKGKYSTTPVETSYGYHIIYKNDQKEKPKLKDVKEDIIDKLVSKKLTDNTTLRYVALEAIRKDAKLAIEDGALLKQYESYIKQLKTSTTSSSN